MGGWAAKMQGARDVASRRTWLLCSRHGTGETLGEGRVFLHLVWGVRMTRASFSVKHRIKILPFILKHRGLALQSLPATVNVALTLTLTLTTLTDFERWATCSRNSPSFFVCVSACSCAPRVFRRASQAGTARPCSTPPGGAHGLCSAARRPGVESLVLQAPGAYHYRISRGPAGPSIAELYSMVQVV